MGLQMAHPRDTHAPWQTSRIFSKLRKPWPSPILAINLHPRRPNSHTCRACHEAWPTRLCGETCQIVCKYVCSETTQAQRSADSTSVPSAHCMVLDAPRLCSICCRSSMSSWHRAKDAAMQSTPSRTAHSTSLRSLPLRNGSW